MIGPMGDISKGAVEARGSSTFKSEKQSGMDIEKMALRVCFEE